MRTARSDATDMCTSRGMALHLHNGISWLLRQTVLTHGFWLMIFKGCLPCSAAQPEDENIFFLSLV